MLKTKTSKLFPLVAMGCIFNGFPHTLPAQDKKPLSKKESAAVIINRLPTADKDREGRVRRLFIAHKRLTDLTALRQCPHLWYLEAAFNNLTNLKGLENCKELTHLNLNHNHLTSLDGIENLPKLEMLFLFGNDLADISPLQKLKTLKLLVLTDNPDLTASQIASPRKSLPACEVLFESKGDDGEKQALGAQQEHPKPTGHQETNLIAQKLAPFATKVQRPKKWFFSQNHEGGNFMWIISKEKLDEASQRFETGVKIQAFFNVSKTTKKSPEAFAIESLEASSKNKKTTTLHQAKQNAGPLTALTKTIELENQILATDVYWGNEKQLDVVVIVQRTAPKNEWNASQRLFGSLTRFNLRTLVEGTRD
ncbi:MAG: hypothetical protein VX438_11575 [Planctomycetota bacterium]|nr:hypothetical protein [Planctomycetota bacterium]